MALRRHHALNGFVSRLVGGEHRFHSSMEVSRGDGTEHGLRWVLWRRMLSYTHGLDSTHAYFCIHVVLPSYIDGGIESTEKHRTQRKPNSEKFPGIVNAVGLCCASMLH